jgi:hypothetical protein
MDITENGEFVDVLVPTADSEPDALAASAPALVRIVPDHVAHPDFQGSYSMKAVAPAVAPEVTYDDLDVAHGGEASAAFYRIIADPTLSPEARNELRQSLLKYCARDTLALAYVHHWPIKGS